MQSEVKKDTEGTRQTRQRQYKEIKYGKVLTSEAETEDYNI